MARSFGKVLASIWGDPAWLALCAGAQRGYVLLISQPRLTLVGSLDLMPGRWARLAADTTVDDVWAALIELERAGFIVIDRATEEVLIRTLTTHDLDPSRLSATVIKGLWTAWGSVSSPILRKVAVDNLPEAAWERSGQIAPPDAMQMRRSPPLDWGTLTPHERETPDPYEREGPLPVESPVSSLLSPSPVAAADESRADSHPDDEHQQQPNPDSGPNDEIRNNLIRSTAKVLARRRAQHRNDVGEGWIHQTAKGIFTDRYDAAVAALQLLDDIPTDEQLADLLEPPPDTTPTESGRTTDDGVPFIPGIGRAPGLPEMPDLDPERVTRLADVRAALRQPHPGDPT